MKVRLTRTFVERQRLAVAGEWQGDILVVDRADWHKLRPSLSTPASWPPWAIELAEAARPGDVGLGDVAEREIGPFGSDAFKVWYGEVAGVMSATCRCAGWKPVWNARYPVLTAG